jgi:hypothetical protein
MKFPPHPPRKIAKRVSGSSSANKLPLATKKSTAERSRRDENGRLDVAGRASSGYLNKC